MFASLKKLFWTRLLIIILVVGAGIGVSWYWLNGQIQEAVKENQDMHGRYEALQGAELDVVNMEANLESISGDVQTLFDSLPAQDEAFRVIDQLEKISADLGLVQTVQVSDQTVADGELVALPVSVQLRGERSALEQYLQRIENLRYFIQEENIEYDYKYTTAQEGGEVAEGVNASLELLIYLKPE